MNKLSKCVAYTRVSTQDQGKKGGGLGAQREDIKRFAEREGIEIVAWYEEVETGKGTNALQLRKELQRALAHAKKVKALLLVAKLDRLSRNSHFISGLMERKVPFYCANLGLDVEPFMIRIFAAVAEKELDQVSERTKAAMAQKKKDGTLKGPPGNHKNLEEAQRKGHETSMRKADEFAEQVYPIIRLYRYQDGLSLRKVAERLNRIGLPTARACKWQVAQVSAIIRRMENREVS